MTEQEKPFRNKLEPAKCKKLLALDGGGIRGLISIEVLAGIEQILRDASGSQDLVLADYFDYIAGTSTGAVIGTLLSLGKSVGEIRDIYLDCGEMMFDKGAIRKRFERIDKAHRYAHIGWNLLSNWAAKLFGPSAYYEYPDEPLVDKLKEIIGGDDVTLGTERLRTLLMLVLSNATTDSPWPVSNNPRAKYNDLNHPQCNLKIPLWQLVRASTAAPSVFPAQEIVMGRKTDGSSDEEQKFVFVDGGVTPYNNPAFQLFLQATLGPYHLEWPVGEEQMLLVSIGTGLNPASETAPVDDRSELGLKKIAETVLAAQFNSAIYQQDLLCRALGRCREGGRLDSEVGDLIGKASPVEPRLFTYLRYNVELSRKGLNALGLPHINPEDVRQLDSIAFMKELQQVGENLASSRVKVEHFNGFV